MVAEKIVVDWAAVLVNGRVMARQGPTVACLSAPLCLYLLYLVVYPISPGLCNLRASLMVGVEEIGRAHV